MSSTGPRIPAILRARARVHTQRLDKLHGELHEAIQRAPIFLCSTHGIYDLDDTSPPCRVPDNTFIFEAQTIGDFTLTEIDEHLWNLIQGPYREGFYRYLTGEEDPKKFSAYDPIYQRVLSNLTLYKPGDTIYKRNLSIGGGRTNTHGTSKRTTYKDMGFFRFDPEPTVYPFRGYGSKTPYGASMPYEILGRMHADLVADDYLETTDCDLVQSILHPAGSHTYLDGRPNDQMFEVAWPRNYPRGAPSIFIFSSCAAITEPTTPAHVTRWRDIATAQRQCELESMAMGLSALGGSHSDSIQETLPSERVLRPKSKGAVEEGFHPSANPFRKGSAFSSPQPSVYRILDSSISRKANASTKKRKRIGGRRTRTNYRKRDRTTRRRS